jgi:cobalt/nickel transport system permease protein
MHIEPGLINSAKLAVANVAAIGVLGYYAKSLLKPALVLRTLAAALFFTLFMQSFHMNVGPSELHFVGAMPMYLLLGFIPTLFGFALGLLVQGLLFEPADLVNLAANSLSLILPLIAVHYTVGQKLAAARISRGTILKLDAVFYSGVTAMVGFWLVFSGAATPFASWATFAGSYLAVVMIEPLFTFAMISLLKRNEQRPLLANLFRLKELKVAN